MRHIAAWLTFASILVLLANEAVRIRYGFVSDRRFVWFWRFGVRARRNGNRGRPIADRRTVRGGFKPHAATSEVVQPSSLAFLLPLGRFVVRAFHHLVLEQQRMQAMRSSWIALTIPSIMITTPSTNRANAPS